MSSQPDSLIAHDLRATLPKRLWGLQDPLTLSTLPSTTNSPYHVSKPSL